MGCDRKVNGTPPSGTMKGRNVDDGGRVPVEHEAPVGPREWDTRDEDELVDWVRSVVAGGTALLRALDERREVRKQLGASDLG